MKPNTKPPVFYTGTALKNTRMCVYFVEGRCKYGSECTYAHSTDELQEAPVELRKTKICDLFLIGQCQDVHCNFAHTCTELKPRIGVAKRPSVQIIGQLPIQQSQQLHQPQQVNFNSYNPQQQQNYTKNTPVETMSNLYKNSFPYTNDYLNNSHSTKYNTDPFYMKSISSSNAITSHSINSPSDTPLSFERLFGSPMEGQSPYVIDEPGLPRSPQFPQQTIPQVKPPTIPISSEEVLSRSIELLQSLKSPEKRTSDELDRLVMSLSL